MGSLKKCLEKVGLDQHEATILRGKSKDFRKEGYEAHDSAVRAVKDYIGELQDERRDVLAQLGGEPVAAKSGEVSSSSPVDEAAQEAATSKQNDLPQPTEAQKDAGNYAKGHVTVGGLDIAIENPAGSKRRPEWPSLKSHYGYFNRTEGKDGDQLDVFVKPGTPEDYSGTVFVVDQTNKDGKFDEHKVMLGFDTAVAAKQGYMENYTPGWTGLGAMKRYTLPEFKLWLKAGNTKKPVAFGYAEPKPSQTPPVVRKKEPWQMTREEFRSSKSWEHAGQLGWKGVGKELVAGTSYGQVHKSRVEQAIAEGKIVPSEVLAEYPEIAESASTKSPAEKPVAKADVAQAEKRDDEALFQRTSEYGKSQPAFYSALARAIEGSKQAKAPAAQWKLWLKNQAGIKQDEIDWLGVNEHLDSMAGPVTKDALLDFVRANEVQVREVTLGMRDPGFDVTKPLSETEQKEYQNLNVLLRSNPTRNMFSNTQRMRYNELSQRIRGRLTSPELLDDTKFAQWQLPGGESYRELLLTLPPPMRAENTAFMANLRGKYGLHSAEWFFNNKRRLTNEEATELDRMAEDVGTRYAAAFRSTHFAEPNILAHIRFNERTDADGRKILFIEEVQSDWHQSGRKRGYSGEVTEQRKAEINKRLQDIKPLLAAESRDSGDWAGLDVERAMLEEELAGKSGVPDAPFKTTWPLLAMKRMIRYAAENGSPGNAAWLDATKPESAREQIQQYLGRELAAVAPFKVVDAAVLGAIKNDQVRRAVVQAIPVDVVNVLADNGSTANQFVSKPDVVGNTLSGDARATVARGLARATQLVGARLRAALRDSLSSDATGREKEILPAVRASDFNAREIVGLLSPSSLYGLDGGTSLAGAPSAVSGAELPITARNDAGKSGEPSATELAEFLNRHAKIVAQRTGNDLKIYEAPAPFARIAWATGTQQADRYDLSKQVEAITWQKQGDRYQIFVYPKSGNQIEKNLAPAEMPDFIGKEASDKITGSGKDTGELRGLDLKVGGEGMRQFYDVMLPSMVNKYVKKWGGKVGETKIATLAKHVGTGWETTASEVEGATPVPSIDITPAMRESVMQGQPLFAAGTTKGHGSGISLPNGIDANLKEKAAALEAAGQSAGTFRITAGKLLDAVLDGPLSKEAREDLLAAKVLQDLFGAPVALISSEGKFQFNGVYHDGTIWISADSSVSLPLVFGHELSHRMEADSPAAYNALLNAVRPMLRNLERYESLNSLEGYSDKFVQKEMLGDLLGDSFGDPGFWQQVAANTSRPEFDRIITAIRMWIDRVIAKLRGLGSEKFVSDLESARKIMAKAVANYADSRKAGDQTSTPEFKKWFGESKVVDENGKPLVVYHGTRSDFNEFDPMAGDTPGSWFTESADAAQKFGRVEQVFLRITNPGKVTDLAQARREVAATGIDAMSSSREFNRAVIGALEARGFDGISQTNFRGAGGPNVFVAFRPEQIKSAIGNRGTFDPNNANIMFSRKTDETTEPTAKLEERMKSQAPVKSASPRLIRAYKERAQKIQTWIDRAMDPFGKLEDEREYKAARNLTHGIIDKGEEIAKHLGRAFNHASTSDKQTIFDYFTTKGAKPDGIRNELARADAVKAKRLIESVSDAMVARGMLSADTREKHRDAYLPQMYLKYLINESSVKALGTGKKPSAMGYLKGRKIERTTGPDGETRLVWKDSGKPLTDVQVLDLGPITDPGFLAATAVARPIRDMALLDFMSTISKNKNWVLENNLVDFDGVYSTPQFLKSEAERLRKQADHYGAEDAKKARAMADRMDTAANKAAGDMVGDFTDYREFPNTAQYGRLRGLWVRKEIYDDLVGVYDLVHKDPGFVQNLLGYGGVGTKLTRMFKVSKVVLSPPAQIRNFFSNAVAQQLSGVPLHKIPGYLTRAAIEIHGDGPAWKIAKKYGVRGGTFAAQELYHIKTELLDLQHREGTLSPLGKIQRIGAIVVKGASDAYQFSEALHKTAKIMHAMDSGMTEGDAAIEAHKWFLDYSAVPKSVRYLRSIPVGIPFLTYQYLMLPRLTEVALLHPQRLLPWLVLFGGSWALVWAFLTGDDEDEYKRLQKALPKWLRERGHALILPGKDDDDRTRVLDAGYWMPWSMYTDAAGAVGRGDLVGAAKKVGVFSGPLTNVAIATATGKDPFTDRTIVEPGDPIDRQIYAAMNYAWDLAAPPPVTSRGLASPMGLIDQEYGGKIVSAVTGRTNKYGDPTTTPAQAALYIFGINVYSIEPQNSTAQNVLRLKYEADQTEQTVKRKLQNRALSDEARREIVEEYTDEMKRRYQKIEEYKK